MNQFPTRELVADLRKMYPPGTRICVDRMENDPHPIPHGTLHCNFDNGRHLGLIWDVDAFHTVKSPADCKQMLKERIDSCYEAYQAEWLAKSPKELVNLAETICSVNLTAELLLESITEEQAEYLLQFKNPLEVVSDHWKEAHFDDKYLLQDELSNSVDHIMDTRDAEQDYELEQPEETNCSENPSMNLRNSAAVL